MNPVKTLQVGMRVKVGNLETTVDEIGLPHNIRDMRGYSGEDDGLLEKTLKAAGVTRLAFLAVDGREKQVAIIEWKGYWWEPLKGQRLEVLEVSLQ